MEIPDLSTRKDLVIWEFDFALTTFFEIPTDNLVSLIPAGLQPVEVLPGTGLVNITAFHFQEGMLGHLPAFDELIFSAVVRPDLSRGVPSFAMVVLSLASTSQEHLDHSRDFYTLPSYGKIHPMNIDRERHLVQVADDDGAILTMENIGADPIYRDSDRYFQAYTTADDSRLTIADLVIKAPFYEHQKQDRAGVLESHPFFRGLELDDHEPQAYLQMLTEPGAPGRQFYPPPEPFR